MVMQHLPPFRPIAVNTPLSRRDLLRCAGAVIGGAALTGALLHTGGDSAFAAVDSSATSGGSAHGDYPHPATGTVSQAADAPIVSGTVENVDRTGLVRIRNNVGITVIALDAGGTIHRGHRGAGNSLAALVPGDEIVAVGAWAGGHFAATALLSRYRLAMGRIVRRDGDFLHLADRTVWLRPDTISIGDRGGPGPALARFGAGDEIISDVWHDPVSGDLVAGSIRLASVA
jgi:hypothetical protein